MAEIICIVCPKGCHVQVEGDHVKGAGCERGQAYAVQESTCPARIITSTVCVCGGAHPRIPVKTDREIPKEMIFQSMQLLNGITLNAPVHRGDIVVKNVCGTNANWIICRDMERLERQD